MKTIKVVHIFSDKYTDSESPDSAGKGSVQPMNNKRSEVSGAVIRRLPRYYRCLLRLEEQGTVKISSRELARIMDLTASQIRQDLNCFGGFGQQGYGYSVSALK